MVWSQAMDVCWLGHWTMASNLVPKFVSRAYLVKKKRKMCPIGLIFIILNPFKYWAADTLVGSLQKNLNAHVYGHMSEWEYIAKNGPILRIQNACVHVSTTPVKTHTSSPSMSHPWFWYGEGLWTQTWEFTLSTSKRTVGKASSTSQPATENCSLFMLLS